VGVGKALLEKRRPAEANDPGTRLNEPLNGEEFESLLEARFLTGAWVAEDNTQRPNADSA
jgi:hypothetical protein